MTTQSNSKPSEFMTVTETCAALKIGRTKFYRLLKEGRLPVRCVRVGDVWRCSRRDADRYLHGEQVTAQSASPEAA